MKRHVALALLTAASLALAAPVARAEPQRADDLTSYSAYEQDTARIALQKTKSAIDPEPDGKVIEGIDIVTLEPFEKRDPIPARLNRFVNWFHVVTKPRFIERELLFKKGERFERRVFEESARNLRALPQLSVAIIVPTKGSAPDRIRMLVVTKDLWSLRWPLEPRLTSSGALESLYTQVLEINLLGTLHQLSANFRYDPNTVSVGGSLTVPRISSSRLRFLADINPIINHRTGVIEGSSGSLSYGQPLFSLATEWSYGARFAWLTDIRRLYISSDVSVFDAASGRCVSPTNSEGEPVVGIPCTYTRDAQSGSIFVTRSFGRDVKHNVTLSADVSRGVYRTPDLREQDPEAAAAFQAYAVPLSDSRLGPGLTYQTFSARFARLLDAERLGLQEDFQMGHRLLIKVSPSYAPLRDSRVVVGLFAGGSYTFPLGDGLARFYLESSTDFEPSRVADGSIDAGVHVISPRTWFGRMIFSGRLLHRYANYLNRNDTLGGDTRLRGFRSGLLRGKDLFALNLELRSRAVEILSCQIGGVLFFDAGDAFNGFSSFDLKRSAGFGLRAMFPQINRVVFRADWGFPLQAPVQGEPRKAFPGELTVTFSQAFGVPSVPVSQSAE